MQPLDKSLRNRLERTIKEARDVAEDAARAALEQLGVGEAAPYPHLSEQQRELRRKLRVHGRQLGDSLNGGKVQTMGRLIEEVAYEHWHRMLFARFLAENDLLMYPDPDDPVAVTLEECDELAADEGAANGWELAARFAARMLPQIFRLDSPVFLLSLPPEHQQKLERFVADLPPEVFNASDSLGWVYQFWQAKKKDEVNASEVKIGARELPAVTQLFTEPYMVSFLLDNSLGAWWVRQCSVGSDQLSVKAQALLKTAASEEELRQFFSRPGIPLEYLRFVKTSPLNPPSMNGGGTFKNAFVTAHNFVTPEKLELAREFRKDPTSKESEVWEWLRDRRMLNLKWRRQQVIEGFIVDFYCAEHHLALELDGPIHSSEQAIEYDQIRDTILAQKGIRTLRISNDLCSHAYLQAQIEKVIHSPSPFMERGLGGEVWTPAAGWFDGWPDSLSELKTLDPCCGSGHFLVAAFLMLVPMRMELEGLSAREAVDAVLRENIHGLELDQRCVELAAFALALTAWKYPSAGGYRVLPELNVACSGLSISAKKEEWLALAGDNTNLRLALDELYKQFKDAPVLGSLINPEASLGKGSLFELKWEEVGPLLTKALAGEKDDVKNEMEVVARGIAKASSLMVKAYDLVITNVPYLARGKHNERLRDFCERHYPEAKQDLATVFLHRCLELCVEGGTTSIVLPQNWLFLTSYKKFREKLLKNNAWHLIARLGPGAFETISGEVVKAILISLSRGNGSTKNTESTDMNSLFSVSSVPSVDKKIRGLDVSEPRTPSDKAAGLITAEIKQVEQAKQLENPDARVAFESDLAIDLLNEIAHGHHGLVCGDRPRMCVNFWEVSENGSTWIPYCGTVNRTIPYGGKDTVLRWCNGAGAIKELKGATNLETHAWDKIGVVVSAMRSLPVTFYTGMAFDNNTAVITSNNPTHLPAIWCFCSSPEYNEAVRQIDQSLKVTNATLVKVPFDLEYWTKVAAEKYPNGLPKPYTDDPTQWIYHGHPCGSVQWSDISCQLEHGPLRTDATVLQVAVARLLGYRWPAELDPNMELADEQREWVNRCEALAGFADEDGIVCIPPVRGEAAASDRLLNLLAAAYNTASPLAIHGEGGWGGEVLAALLKSADHAGKTLETWLRDKFFTQHCKLFHQRPFIWHIWDGLRDGFAALVNYHKLDYKLLETLTYTYLGDWISRQKQDIANGVDGAQERLAAAENLKKKLELILEGEEPYDIFVRWKPLEQQPIGWNPDLNDGVRLNIRPFLTVPDVGKKGAGCLRDKPNINWDKDRGKDVASAPWYHLFNGDRINDHHLTLAEKRAAREAAE